MPCNSFSCNSLLYWRPVDVEKSSRGEVFYSLLVKSVCVYGGGERVFLASYFSSAFFFLA